MNGVTSQGWIVRVRRQCCVPTALARLQSVVSQCLHRRRKKTTPSNSPSRALRESFTDRICLPRDPDGVFNLPYVDTNTLSTVLLPSSLDRDFFSLTNDSTLKWSHLATQHLSHFGGPRPSIKSVRPDIFGYIIRVCHLTALRVDAEHIHSFPELFALGDDVLKDLFFCTATVSFFSVMAP